MRLESGTSNQDNAEGRLQFGRSQIGADESALFEHGIGFRHDPPLEGGDRHVRRLLHGLAEGVFPPVKQTTKPLPSQRPMTSKTWRWRQCSLRMPTPPSVLRKATNVVNNN